MRRLSTVLSVAALSLSLSVIGIPVAQDTGASIAIGSSGCCKN